MLASRFTLAAAGLLCASLALPVPSHAQASREGPTFAAAGAWPGFLIRYPDIAYDPVNDVYLVVTAPMTHGRFQTADGVPLGTNEFYIPSSPAYNAVARAAYGEGSFLVTWLDVRSDPRGNIGWVYGRLVSYGAGGTPTFAGPDFLIGAAVGGVNPERAAAVTYSTVSKEFLVVYHQAGGGPGVPVNDIRGQRVSATGQLIGGPINISFDNHFQGEVSVGYSPTSDTFLVAYRHFYEPAGPATIQTRTVKAGTGALGTAADIEVAGNTNVPEVVWDSKQARFMVAWWRGLPGAAKGMYLGRTIDADGTAVGTATPLILNYGGYDSLGVAYNVRSDTFFAVIHGRAPATFPQEDVGAEVSSSLVASAEFDVTLTGNKAGNYNPRIATSTARNEWMAITSTGFLVASGQRIKTQANGGGPPPPPPPPPPPIELSGPNVPNGSWFLAEGAESGTPTGFHTFYLIANENDEEVDARVWFCGDDGRIKYQLFKVPGRSRKTVNLQGAAGNGSFGAIFQSLTPAKDIYVSRSIYWGANFEGSTGVSATKDLATSWYFAEGSRGGELFDNFFLIFNPLPQPTNVTVTFLTSTGEVIPKTYTVPAEKRLTLYANSIPELANKDFSTTIAAQGGIIAERAMYWRLLGSADPTWIGGTASIGAIAPQTSWVFAEGAAADRFETFYLLLNPNQTPITVRARFLLESGSPVVKDYLVPARSRFTVYMNGELGNVGGAAATFSSTTLPFLAERSIYWGTGRVEGTNVVGSPTTSSEWHFPEGSAGGQFDTYLLFSNPGVNDSTIVFTVFVEDVGRFTLPALAKTVRAGSRLTVYMNDFLGEIERSENLAPGTVRGKSFSTKVTVVNGDPIVGEEAMYWQRAGADYWRAGSASFGIPLP